MRKEKTGRYELKWNQEKNVVIRIFPSNWCHSLQCWLSDTIIIRLSNLKDNIHSVSKYFSVSLQLYHSHFFPIFLSLPLSVSLAQTHILFSSFYFLFCSSLPFSLSIFHSYLFPSRSHFNSQSSYIPLS